MSKKTLPHHIKHMFAAFGYSVEGIIATFKSETAFIQETITLFVLPILGWFYGLPKIYLLLLIAAWLLVMAIELLNMAIECICNLISPDFHPLVKVAKDAGSAAVLLALTANLCFWIFLIYSFW